MRWADGSSDKSESFSCRVEVWKRKMWNKEGPEIAGAPCWLSFVQLVFLLGFWEPEVNEEVVKGSGAFGHRLWTHSLIKFTFHHWKRPSGFKLSHFIQLFWRTQRWMDEWCRCLSSVEVGRRHSAEISPKQEGQKGLISLTPQHWPPPPHLLMFLPTSSSSSEVMKPRWNLFEEVIVAGSKSRRNSKMTTAIRVWTGLSWCDYTDLFLNEINLIFTHHSIATPEQAPSPPPPLPLHNIWDNQIHKSSRANWPVEAVSHFTQNSDPSFQLAIRYRCPSLLH